MKLIDLIIKDLKLMFGDRKALLIMIIMPIVLTTILSFALNSNFEDSLSTNRIKVAIVKEYDKEYDNGKLISEFTDGFFTQYVSEEQSAEIMNSVDNIDVEKIFMEDFLENEEIKKIIEYQVANKEDAMKLLEEKKVATVVILPKNFIYDMNINFLTPFRNKVDIKVIGHPEMQFGTQITESIMMGFADMTSSMIIGKNVFLESAIENDFGQNIIQNLDNVIEGITQNFDKLGVNIEYEKLEGRKPITSAQYYAVAIAAMFILYAAGHGSKLLLDEKNNITYQRMMIAGTPRWKMLLSNFVTIYVLALLQITILLIFSTLVLKADWGNPLYVLLISLCVVFATAGVGILVSVITFLSGNYNVGEVFQSAVIQAMALLGGSFIPIEILPKFMQHLSNFTINGLAIKSYLEIMTGSGLDNILNYLIGLITMGVSFIMISIVMISRERGGDRYAKCIKTKANEPA